MSGNRFKIVLDTSTIVSAFFWEGNESKLFGDIEEGKVKLYVTREILDEVSDVIRRPKFKHVMFKADLTPEKIIEKIISVSSENLAPNLMSSSSIFL